jgi:capsular exopolysaccharide synthesis family protein
MRFLRVLRYRKSYVMTSVAVACLLGAFYYFTATRIYKATASLLITQTGGEMWNTSTSPQGSRDALTPTYERLFSSAVVLDGAIQRLIAMPPTARIDLAGLSREDWREGLRGSLSANAVRGTSIIELSYRSKSPDAAEAVVDAVVQSYLDFMAKNHKDVSVEVAKILQKELAEKEQELRQKQRRLLEVVEASGALNLPDGGTVVHPVVQRVVRLNETLIEVQKQRLQLEASLAAVRAAVRNGGDLRQHLLTVEPTVGREVLMNALGLSPQYGELANQMEQQLLHDRARLITLQDYYGPTHPEVVELHLGIEGAERRLLDYQSQLDNRLKSIHEQRLGPMLVNMMEEKLAETWHNERQLIEEYKRGETEALRLNGRLAELELARNEVRRLTNWHETLLNQIANLDLRQEHRDVRVAIVSEPMASNEPVAPKRSMIGVLCLFGGISVGCALVYVLDLLDDRFRSPEEIKEQIGAPVLAMVRKLDSSPQGGAESLHMHVSPSSVECEAFRTLRTALAFSGAETNRVAITSSEPGDGKTTVLANLAVSYAQAGKSTLLVDCDLRRPGLSKLFDLRREPGVSDVLRGDVDIQVACQQRIQAAGVDGLDILPCGPKPPDPADLLSSSRFMDLIAWAETHYDQVLIDCPPVLAASDAAIVGRLVDGVILVVQPEKNHRRLVLRAAEILAAMDVSLFGTVANRMSDEKGGGYYGYGYGYDYADGDGYEDEEELEEASESQPARRAQQTPRRAA